MSMKDETMEPIIQKKEIMSILYYEFSNRFCSTDIWRLDKIKNEGQKHVPLLLSINTNTEEYINLLNTFGYPELIAFMLMNCDLNDNLKNACEPQFTDIEFQSIKEQFESAQMRLKYTWIEKGLVFSCPEFFADIIICPLSQFHHEIINALDTFLPFKKNNINGFLEAYSPSFFTQFSQYWIAEKLDMLETKKNICVI